MQNTIVRTVGFLVSGANKAIAGMEKYAGDLFLPHATKANLPGALAALTLADTRHKEAVQGLRTKRAALKSARASADEFIRLVRELLRGRLGKKYSQRWEVIGLSGSLRVPRSEAGLLRVLHSIEAYLTTQPLPDAGPQITAVRAGELYHALVAASGAVDQQKTAMDEALRERRKQQKQVERGLRMLLGELHQVLTPLDSRWLAFGFKKPGAKQAPSAPQNAVAVLIGEGAMSIKWDPAPRAEYYRVWERTVGVEKEPVPIGSPADLDFTMEYRPGSAPRELFVSAVNDGGESPKSIVLLRPTPTLEWCEVGRVTPCAPSSLV